MTVEALLQAEPTVERIMLVARVAVGQFYEGEECPSYFEALADALQAEPPPFGTENYAGVYEEASADLRWMATSLIANAEREGDGATRLWSMAACCTDVEQKEMLKRHAVDESSHALAYLSILNTSFPGVVSPEFKVELKKLSPGYSMAQEPLVVPGSPYARAPSIDDYIQMNIAEIRTTIHHIMQRRALKSFCDDQTWFKVTKILDSLLRDELKHVAYTAVLIERLQYGGMPDLFRKRLRDFNEITNKELCQRVFD